MYKADLHNHQAILMPRPTLTAVVNAHREGLIAKPSLESLKRSVAHAEAAGHEVEVLIVLDRPDDVTRSVVAKNKLPNFQVVETDFGDLGMARNLGIAHATGDFIALLDADDLWGVDWLTKAVSAASQRTGSIVWHPEVNVYFGAARHIFRHVDMEDEEFEPVGLVLENHWTSLSFGAREIYLDNPYPETDLRTGFGFEDWAWNMRTISNGVLHKVVAGTGHVIRRKEMSLAQQTAAANAVPRPQKFLRWVIDQNGRAGDARQ